MTLDEMAQFVCGKVNQTEAEDVTACKGFLQRRHEMLWAEALWKDSLVEYRQTLSPTEYETDQLWLPTKGVLLLPIIIQRVLAVRTSTRKLNVQRPEYFYRIDFDAFSQSGDPQDYVLLPPCVWEFDDLRYINVRRESEADKDISAIVEMLLANAVDVERRTVKLENSTNPVLQTGRIDRLTKPTTSGSVYLDESAALLGWVLKNNSGVTLIVWINSVDDLESAASGTVAAGTERIFVPATYVWVSEEFPAPEGLESQQVPNGEDYHGRATWSGGTLTFAASNTIATLSATDTNAPLRQRIRFIEIPSAEMTVRVLGKRIVPTFDDNDQPALNGSENSLIAFAHGDMLQRERQYAKAQTMFQEGMLLLDQLKRVETVQQAHNVRITPEGGYGEASDLYQSNGIF